MILSAVRDTSSGRGYSGDPNASSEPSQGLTLPIIEIQDNSPASPVAMSPNTAIFLRFMDCPYTRSDSFPE